MTKYEIEVVQKLLGTLELKCRKSKSGKYDGWRCNDIPDEDEDWSLDDWCTGCLASMVQSIINTYR